MKNGKIKIARNTQNWWGFTLQRGHAFGLIDGVCYVSAAEPDPKRPGFIVVYKQKKDKQRPEYYRWNKESVLSDSPIGVKFVEAIKTSPFDGVTFPEEKFNIQTVWKDVPGHLTKSKQYYDDTPWRPRFPTFRDKRPTAMPRIPVQRAQHTWVDQICAEAAAAR